MNVLLKHIATAVLIGLLAACGGSQVADRALIDDDKGKGRGDGIACADIYAPVCSVRPEKLQCITAPCPIGIHQTYPNRCGSDRARATFLFSDVCGDLEDQPYFEEITACTKEYRPVCAADRTIAPCDTLPCPAVVHKTYGNACEAQAAKAWVIAEDECGKLEGMPVTNIEGACTAIADPVCGKDEGSIVCITEPCPTHEYRTFGNSCEAGLALAAVVLHEQCGPLQGTVAFAEPPVNVVAELPAPEKGVTVGDVSFAGDVLKLTLGYSGCNEQHFHFYVSNLFKESSPVQVAWVFEPMVEDACEAYFTTQFVYDLIPLKHAYQQAYRTETGTINLPGIGNYIF